MMMTGDWPWRGSGLFYDGVAGGAFLPGRTQLVIVNADAASLYDYRTGKELDTDWEQNADIVSAAGKVIGFGPASGIELPVALFGADSPSLPQETTDGWVLERDDRKVILGNQHMREEVFNWNMWTVGFSPSGDCVLLISSFPMMGSSVLVRSLC